MNRAVTNIFVLHYMRPKLVFKDSIINYMEGKIVFVKHTASNWLQMCKEIVYIYLFVSQQCVLMYT